MLNNRKQRIEYLKNDENWMTVDSMELVTDDPKNLRTSDQSAFTAFKLQKLKFVNLYRVQYFHMSNYMGNKFATLWHYFEIVWNDKGEIGLHGGLTQEEAITRIYQTTGPDTI